jgi:hypothetical protein
MNNAPVPIDRPSQAELARRDQARAMIEARSRLEFAAKRTHGVWAFHANSDVPWERLSAAEQEGWRQAVEFVADEAEERMRERLERLLDA